jgi:HSP20 family molecular chaperone IbpA
VEIHEQNDGTRLTLRIVCPGLRPDEISIVVDGARVRIRAEHAEDSGSGSSRKRSSSRVAHAASIPPGTTSGEISAWLGDGVLEVRHPAVLGSGTAVAIPVQSA